jgi:signal transduction histidine kinase
MIKVQHDFLSSVSHELRTPMTSMRMFLEALLDDRLTDPAERANCLRALHRQVDRLDGLVGKLIELSRVETEKHPYEERTVEIGPLIREVLSAFEAMRRLDHTRLHVDIEDGLCVAGDRLALVQVIDNLLSNAWKYSGDQREIHLVARGLKDREVEIAVRDHGPGIPVEEASRVFEKFWRGQSAQESGTAGSGLGLSIVQSIVRAHRGRIELRSPKDGGAEFHVFLPRTKAPPPVESANARPDAAPPPSP